eukprot:TRINITY_DN13798_c0_g1_i2.p1 TRINITY_DN13798_c0_g1~~TRINITY_DN13798_c0_g1_i2.p1  ORF type:complete len:599 (+),score=171.20 TRINITY_DN13798_c0_g1_i2:86-1798(+)
MTSDEMKRFKECMKDPKFMDLWNDYAAEISDPANLAEQEEYLKQVEKEAKEQGDHSFTFIFPKANFCVKLNCKERTYINICDDEKVDEPVEETTGNAQASSWNVPISLGKPRNEVFNDKTAVVIDACYHPKATYLAKMSDKFMIFLVEIAVENVNHSYINKEPEFLIKQPLPMQFSRVQECASVGNPAAQTIRIKAVKGREGELVIEQKKQAEETKPNETFKNDTEFQDRLKASMGDTGAKNRIRTKKEAERAAKQAAEDERLAAIRQKREQEAANAANFKKNLAAAYGGNTTKTKPVEQKKYTILHQGEIGYQDCWNSTEKPERKLPKSLKVQIPLPTVTKVSELSMQVEPRLILLSSEKLGIDESIPLPYDIDPDRSAAKFEKSKKLLTVTLAVIQKESDFEINYKKEKREEMEKFSKEAKEQADEEQREKEEEMRKIREEKEAEEREKREKEEAENSRRREMEAALEAAAKAERERRELEKRIQEQEMEKKRRAELEAKLGQLDAARIDMHVQEEKLRQEAMDEHDKLMNKIRREIENTKETISLAAAAKRKQEELPFESSLIHELD